MTYDIKQYDSSFFEAWNTFSANAKNSTFLHNRNFMDYHKSRFEDCSLIFMKKGSIKAVLPANRKGNVLYSHQGLTYGGFLTPTKHFDVRNMLDIFDDLKTFLPGIGIKEMIYKPAPHIYHKYPAEEDLYALFVNGGKLVSSSVSSTINLCNRTEFNENARRAVNHAIKCGIRITECNDYPAFWNILSDTLENRHGVKPVHTLDEIQLLHSRFPEQIRLFTAKDGDEIVAGTVIFDTGMVAHAQYIAASPCGFECKALPLVFDKIISNEFRSHKYFDFGISTENGGMTLNEGLSSQKSGMGGRGIVYNSYSIRF